MSTVVSLFDGDPRAHTLFEALKDVVYERGKGMPVPTVLGVLEILKSDITHSEFCEACR
jgi:hypothetical protein